MLDVRRMALAGLLLLTACSPSAPATPQSGGQAPAAAEEKADNQVIRIALKGLVGNPSPQASAYNFWLYWPMYDNLTYLDQTFKVNPSIAETWTLAPDGLSWRLKLSTAFKFSNGEPVTAEDVAFTINTMVTNNWPQKGQIAGVTEAKVVDATTVDVFTRAKDVTIPAVLGYVWVIPKKYFESVGPSGFAQKPIGSGPYTLESFVSADSMTFKKRPEAHPLRQVTATELVFKQISENSQIINGLNTGELDMALQVSWNGPQIEQIKKAGLNINAPIAIQTQMSIVQGTYEAQNSPLKELKVRQALNYAIDRKGLVDNLFLGYAKASNQPAIPGAPAFNTSIPDFPYDPAKAKQMLAEAGYPNGFTLKGGIDFTTGQVSQEIPVAVQGFLRDIGVQVELISNENAIFVDKSYGRNNQVKGDFWMGRSGDATGFGPSRVFLGCNKPSGAPPAALLYCNPAWDAVLDAAYAEPDDAKRAVLLKQATQISLDEAIQILLFNEPSFIISSPKIQGVNPIHTTLYTIDTVYRIK